MSTLPSSSLTFKIIDQSLKATGGKNEAFTSVILTEVICAYCLPLELITLKDEHVLFFFCYLM